MKQNTISMNEAFSKLEALVEQFESGQIDIEQSIAKFQEGLELAKLLKKRLAKIENEIVEVKKQYDTQME